MTKSLINRAFEIIREFRKDLPEDLHPLMFPPTPFNSGIPTLQKDVYRESSSIIKERFSALGRWKFATHGHWLDISDMEELWGDPKEQLMQDIKMMWQAGQNGCPDEASTLFRPERLSLFACSDLVNERMYLLWLDLEDEPEIWVYDSNGETRYKDLVSYLEAYISEDVSAVGQSWHV